MAPATPQQRRRAIARAGSGKALSLDETEALLWARGDDLERLMAVASGLRELGHGQTVTYSRKVFIPLTMLCRDHCHYCTFAKPPAKLDHPFLTPDEVVAIAEAGRKMGCKEALFTLGDRPEERYEVARRWLDERGFGSTLEYLRAVAIRVIEETGLLPHLNPGVMSYEELARLKHVSASMGMMLETSSERLSERGGPHFGSPDKVPAVRLRTIEDAGRLAIPFTTGILVGIGETPRERAESLFASRIVQSVDLTFAAVDAIAGNLTDEQIKAAEPALHAQLNKLEKATGAVDVIIDHRRRRARAGVVGDLADPEYGRRRRPRLFPGAEGPRRRHLCRRGAAPARTPRRRRILRRQPAAAAAGRQVRRRHHGRGARPRCSPSSTPNSRAKPAAAFRWRGATA